MSDRSADCLRFDAHAEDVALGHAGEPVRAELVEHAARCADCHELLEGLVAVTDRLLLLAPEVEPPAGFEGRVLAALDHRHARSRSPRRGWVLATAAVVLAVVGVAVGAFLAGRLTSGDDSPPVAGTVVSSSGEEVGTISLVADPAPHVLLALDGPRRSGGGVQVCELQAADGTWHAVGSWEAADVYAGVWAAGIDAELLDATAMRITSGGEVVATADLS